MRRVDAVLALLVAVSLSAGAAAQEPAPAADNWCAAMLPEPEGGADRFKGLPPERVRQRAERSALGIAGRTDLDALAACLAMQLEDSGRP